jgi:site-specific DNA recombinase
MIFFDYLSGMGRNAIVKKLNALELETRRGGRWGESSVAKVLCNEKYTGDMLLQKTFVADHLTKKKCFNHGQLPQYYVSGSHEAIIDKDTFERVQQELKRRAEWYHPSKQTPTRYPFTSVIQCGLCGQHYRRKIANAGGKYAKPVWICPTFNTRGKAACSSKQIPEDILQAVSAEALGIPMFDFGHFRGADYGDSGTGKQPAPFHLPRRAQGGKDMAGQITQGQLERRDASGGAGAPA